MKRKLSKARLNINWVKSWLIFSGRKLPRRLRPRVRHARDGRGTRAGHHGGEAQGGGCHGGAPRHRHLSREMVSVNVSAFLS